jgi:hypothetical protein
LVLAQVAPASSDLGGDLGPVSAPPPSPPPCCRRRGWPGTRAAPRTAVAGPLLSAAVFPGRRSGAVEPCCERTPKLTSYYCINHSHWSLYNNTELTCRLCRVKPGKSLTTKDRKPYIKTHTKASLEINKSQFITSIPIKGT